MSVAGGWQAVASPGIARRCFMFGTIRRGPENRLSTDRLPLNHSLSWRLRIGGDEGIGRPAPGERVREPALALIEAALFAADEPLNPRRLAALARVKDVRDVRRLIRKLQAFYQADGSAFQIEEL